MIKLCHQIIHLDLGRTNYRMALSEKIKTIDNKIEQNKVQYDLGRQAALSLGNVGKYNFHG